MIKIVINTFFTKTISALSNLLVAILISKMLGAEAKGETSILLTSITIVLLFTNIIGGGTIAFLLSKYNYKNILKWFNLTAITVSTASFFIFYFFSNSFLFSINCSVLSFIVAQFSFYQNVYLCLNKIKQLNLVVATQSLLLLFAVFLGLTLTKLGTENYTIGLYFSYLFSLAMSLIFFKKNKHELQKQTKVISFFTLLTTGIQNQLAHVFYLFLMRFSYYLLLWYSGKFNVGVFSNAIIIAEGIWLITSSLATVQYAKIINSAASEAINITLTFCRIAFTISICFIFIIYLFPNQIFINIFGKDFHEIKAIVLYLSPGIVVYNFAIIIGHFFSGLGKFKINTIANFIGLIITLGSLFFYYKKFSIQQAIVFHNIAYFSISASLIYFFIKNNKIKIKTLFYHPNDLIYLKKLFIKQ